MSSGGRLAKTLVVAVVVMVVAGFLPALAMGLLGWSSGVTVAMLAGMASYVACIGGNGWRTGLIIAVPFAVLAGLADWAGAAPWPAAIVLAVAAFLCGYAARLGLHDALIMTVIALGFIVASPPASDTAMPAPIYVGLVSLATVLWATFVIYLLRNLLKPRPHTGLAPIRVIAFSVVLSLMVGTATWFVVDLGLGHTGAWIILTIVVVFQPSLGAGFRKALDRATGTVLGFVVAIIIGAVLPSGALIYIVASVFLMASFVFMLEARPYWMFAAALTTGIVLLESGVSTVDVVAEERLAASFIGIAATLVVMLALSPLAKHLVRTGAVTPATVRPPAGP